MAEKVEHLRPRLAEAQKALEAALDEACDTDVPFADTSELIRLEESLTVARDAARSAIFTLQRLRHEEQQADETQSLVHRIFVDDHGMQWDAFPVYPSRATSGRYTLPAPYHEGWLSMQCPHEIRRLTPIPEQWKDLSREELCKLLSKATAAPRRARPKDTQSDNPNSRA
jgi:hypothetical protein